MKRLYDFITKANQVLLFLAILGAGSGISYMIFQESRHSYREPEVAIAHTAEEAGPVVVDDLQILGKADGYYVFGLYKRLVGVPSGTTRKMAMELYSSGDSRDDRSELVNVVFAREGKRLRTLLASDGLVLWHHLAYRTRDDAFNFHQFRCIREDTNGDGVLNKKDRTDLIVVSRDLNQPDFVIPGVMDTDVLNPTALLVKVVDPTGIHFTEVDCEARTQKEIVWK